MKNIILLCLILGAMSISCLTLRTAQNENEFNDSFQYHGSFDSSAVLDGRFIQPKYTMIYTDSLDMIPIWGKRCEFIQGEGVYTIAEWWSTPPGSGHCKYFVINLSRTLKYSIK